MRPTQPAGSDSGEKVALGRAPVPALANTALPEPVIRLAPNLVLSQRATPATAGQ